MSARDDLLKVSKQIAQVGESGSFVGGADEAREAAAIGKKEKFWKQKTVVGSTYDSIFLEQNLNFKQSIR